jgi:intraflagellar transport protein 56
VGKEKRDDLPEIVNMLRNASNPQVEYILRVMKHWAKGQTINA